MYGLINRAIEQMVTQAHGEPGWQRICARAQADPDGFVAMRSYPDELTGRLVGAASVELQCPADEVLAAFGEHWILYTAEEGYAELLRAAGSDLRQFLGNLNDLHGRVETIFPQMRLPTFRVEDIDADSYHLYYGSTREGLAPMVIGLVQGLARRFGQTVEVALVQAKRCVHEEDRFLIRHLPSAA